MAYMLNVEIVLNRMANVTRQIVQFLFEQLLIRYADTIDPRVKEPSLSF